MGAIQQVLLGYGGSFDPDAQAFIAATGITDAIQKNTINQLVLDLKEYSLWNKMYAIYPYVGGTATTHKFNLKDPQDTDSAFRIVWSGGITHSATGVIGNGSNGSGDTKFNPSIVGVNQNSYCFGLYSRTNNTTSGYDMGIAGGFTARAEVNLVGVSSSTNHQFSNNRTSISAIARGRTDGFFVVSRINSTNTNLLRNGVSITNPAVASTGIPTNTVRIFYAVGGSTGAGTYSNREQAFAFMSSGLDTTEVTNLYTIVQAYQTALSRQV